MNAKKDWKDRSQGYEYKSSLTLLGLPLLHIAAGNDPVTGRQRVAKGIIALGQTAIGVIAVGTWAYGGITCAAVGIGLVSLSFVGIGLVSWSFVGIGVIASGMIAIGYTAKGMFAVGYSAQGWKALSLQQMSFDSLGTAIAGWVRTARGVVPGKIRSRRGPGGLPFVPTTRP